MMSIRWKNSVSLLALSFLLFAFASCKMSVNKNDESGQKKVEIKTPFGGLKVNEDVNKKDVGLAIYPGAAQEADNRDDSNANVNIDTSFFGMKLVALKFTTADSPEKVLSFYRNEMKSYGNVIECSGEDGDVTMNKHDDKDLSRPVTCGKQSTNSRKRELKVGVEGNQHIVAVEPKGNGTKFALVYLRARTSRESEKGEL